MMTSVEEFNCLFCQDVFETKDELQVHFRKHGDPKFNQSVKSKTQTEMAANGDRVDDGETVSCDVCEEVFPTISKAITHKHKMHPDHDAKYFCPWCGKLFTMKHLYNKHIQSTHNSKEQSGGIGFHCDYCEVDFFVPSAMVYHNKFFHRQDTELAAIGHSKKLKMYNQEPLQVYYCPFCGEEYCNKVNLHKHMGDDHIDENQTPEDILRCPLCEAVFYHLDAYELHLTFHATNDQYSEENELLKEITEFSLETVPPMMEKVENESQEDEPTETVGIEELLQQGMNESNEIDTCDEPRKKKKHKKHKKSKKTITLDEFLNMHSDVLGEGLDVQGIVEVPTQVVKKQLRKPQMQKMKSASKPLPSAELAKLKKAGIVIKKKPSLLQGMKIANRKPITAQIGSNIKQSVQTQPDIKTSSNEILSKLLSKSNSQIKIVKKSATSNVEGDVLAFEKESSENKECKARNNNGNENSLRDDENGEVDNTNEKITGFINDSKEEKTEACLSQNISQELDNQCPTNVSASVSQTTKENTLSSNEPVGEKQYIDKPLNLDKEFAVLRNSDMGKTITHNVNAINALRNISQHITIKSVSSPISVTNNQITPVKENDDDEKISKSGIAEENNIIGDVVPEQSKKNPFNALKHLSHLTVKSTNQPQIRLPPTVHKDNDKKNNVHSEKKSDISDIEENEGQDETETHKAISFTVKDKDNKYVSTKLDPLRNLSKHITVKPLSQSPNSPKNDTEKPDTNLRDDCEDFDLIDTNLYKSSKFENKQNAYPNRQPSMKTITNLSPGAKSSSPNNSPKVQRTDGGTELHSQSNNELVVYNAKVPSTPNILNQLLNITAKPVNVAKNITQKVMVQSSTQSINVQKGNYNITQNNLKKIETKQKEEIEIFNIDDSDDEDTSPPESIKNQQYSKPISVCKKVDTTSEQEKSMEVFKNLGKHITIKPKNPPKSTKDEGVDEFSDDNLLADEIDNESYDTLKAIDNQVNTLLQNKLKSLGNITMKSTTSSLKNLGNITMKSTNSSPKNLTPSQTSPLANSKDQMEEYDSDPATSPKVEITELPDDYPSDEDIPLERNKVIDHFNEDVPEQNYDIDSDNEGHVKDSDGHFDDIENNIKPCTLRKPTPNLNKTPACLNNLKNLTVKSLKENKVKQLDEELPEDVNEDYLSHPAKNRQLGTRPSGQDVSVDESIESPNKMTRPHLRRSLNQNTSTSSNQVNTVNKEVTVQTYQTKTVIQEITTTVTKTIRTVNQATQQEIQNMSQKTSMPIRPQRIQGIRPNHQIKNLQGMSVRPAAPIIRPRMKYPVTPTRPPVNANVQPSNHLLPVRPVSNVARLSNPRMPLLKKGPTSLKTGPNKPVVGKPLKISPNAVLPTMKRSTADEATGPFSCFKKPKESLIPGAISDFSGDSEGESAVQFTSSHMNRSKFSSSTKTVKGNSVVKSMEMKSEVSASSEHLNRLNSMSGLKIVRSCQMKQASKVEERTEVNPAKRNALDAIEKLQKQGLLVKKPRIEEPDDSEHSNPDDAEDDYYDT